MTALLSPAEVAASALADGHGWTDPRGYVTDGATADRAHVAAWLLGLAAPTHPPIPPTPEVVEAVAREMRAAWCGCAAPEPPWERIDEHRREDYRLVARVSLTREHAARLDAWRSAGLRLRGPAPASTEPEEGGAP